MSRVNDMPSSAPLLLDDFSDVSHWEVHTTEGVQARLEVDKAGGKGLKLTYDFCGRAGYALIRKKVALRLPENYAINFDVKGQSPSNTLEIKLIDASRDNVWWVHRPSYKFAAAYETVRNKARHFSYAWGPDKSRLVDVAYLELCITATAGGKGSVSFANLTYAELPPVGEHLPLVAFASTNGADACFVVDRNPETAWTSDENEKQTLILDLGANREFGGLTIDFGSVDYARDFSVASQVDGDKRWSRFHFVRNSKSGRVHILATESEARYLRISMHRSSRGKGYRIKSVDIKPLAFGKSVSDFWMNVAKDTCHGLYPRHLLGEQCYWTITGVETDKKKALINEDALVETEKLGFSLEPFLHNGKNLLTWKEGAHDHTLQDGYLPVPTVERKHDGLVLRVRPWALGKPAQSVLYVGYEVTNTSEVQQTGKLLVAVRPYQVNPAWQFLNAPGGFAPIYSLKRQKNGVVVNGDKQVIEASERATEFGCTIFDRGDISSYLAEGSVPRSVQVSDKNGFASAAFSYAYDLAPGQTKRVVLAVPLHEKHELVENVADSRDLAVEYWRKRLERVNIKLPPQALELELTYKAQAGYILLNRSGVGIQPGVRCYDRSWARDGALTSSALLQLGYNDEVRDFINWFAGYQFDSGKIPCVVDHRGADPTPEHDSPGEFIYLVAEYYRYTGDKKLLSSMFQRVVRTVAYVETLLETTRTADFDAEDKRHLRGLLPPSISHEGYSDKPAYSYWDDFWCLKGLRDAVFLAREYMGAGHKLTVEFERVAERFRKDFFASIEACKLKYGIDTIVGAADRGDKDACSTTMAVDPCLLASELADDLERTFANYWTWFCNRMNRYSEWTDYTPYEVRAIGTLIRLGHRDWAHQSLHFFMPHRRPQGWRHWAECVHNDRLKPAFIGDMPHTWVGSDFVRSIRTMMAYEREDGVLVIGGGFRWEWMYEPGEMKLVDLPTEFGRLTFTARRSGYRLFIRIEGEVKTRMVLTLPTFSKGMTVNGRPGVYEVPVGKLPADIVIELA